MEKETKVAAVSMKNITKTFGSVIANDKVNLDIYKGEILSLLGENGSGKTTLMNMLSGIYFPDEGQIFINGKEEVIKSPKDALRLGIGMVHQHFKLIDVLSATENIILGLEGRLNIKEASRKIEEICDKYGFEVDPKQKIYDMTVSQKQTVEIVKLLYRGVDILILDEPTNHLDIESIQWLEDFLIDNGQAVVVISHDRAFVDHITTRTIEVTMGRIYDYKVNYSQYLQLRKERREQQQKAYDEQQKMIAETREFIERFKGTYSKTLQVQSRVKMLEKLELIEVDEEDTSRLRLKFPPSPRSGAYPIQMSDVAMSFDDKKIFSGVNLTVERGDKIAFVGRNGEGKSTLVKCIMGQLQNEGKLELGHNVQIGYFAQNQASLLDGELTVFQTIDDVAKGEIRNKIRDLLGAFMFGGEDSTKKVKVLSGGERTRLAILKLLLEPVNLLILDEPTNHLDLKTKDVLKQALLDFDGTLIVVSHDRDFLDGLVSKVYEFGHGRVREHLCGIYEFLESKKMENLQELEKKQ